VEKEDENRFILHCHLSFKTQISVLLRRKIKIRRKQGVE
jgi:hypothetical protein